MSQPPPNEASVLTNQVFFITIFGVLAFGAAVIVYVIS
jgi:hypothetical protein